MMEGKVITLRASQCNARDVWNVWNDVWNDDVKTNPVTKGNWIKNLRCQSID